ncbi:unnamed protein product [Enterobius vermicularis]|uniref:MFS domain-containing protein n=1 Tax=Enterobius vermicularis TaxID=51028 RepID=A0A0N4VNC2_ENTVE|nr:unnamed protein product [Enterobius vermicularis]
MGTDDWLIQRLPPHLQAISVIIGGVLVQLSLGGIYTFGNMLPYLISYIRARVDSTMTSGTLIWLQTLMAGIPFALVLGGYLEKKIGPRPATLLGCLLYTTSVALTYYSLQKSFFLVMITLGLCATTGLGIAYNTVLILAQQWFPTRIGFASGIIVGGFGFSAFIFSPIQTKYINQHNYVVNTQGYFTQKDLLDRVPKVFLLLAGIYAVLQILGIILLCRPSSVSKITSFFTTLEIKQSTLQKIPDEPFSKL